MASRKYQISEKFRHLNIEKIPNIWEIQLSEHRENIRYLRNSSTMTSRKYHQISDIRYMRNFDI